MNDAQATAEELSRMASEINGMVSGFKLRKAA